MDEMPRSSGKSLTKRIVGAPFPWLLFQAGLLAIAFWLGGFMAVRRCADSAAYVSFDFSSPAGVLGGIRTLAYPLLLKAIAMASPDYRPLPAVQLMVHFLAVFLFWKALTIYGLRGWVAWAAASPLLYLHPDS